ncbi:hypothetical protein OUZ56_009347 [Daphnia magna]|uniref:THAP-type domain-containing protein n=1 Tax=Daphnia magna TaxID=35525 RepID=A0ABR0AFQ6_9CRUS|nr:hypothetical protein OUZ56_009347 [Daphnia magna]
MPYCFVIGCRNGPKKLRIDRSVVLHAEITKIKPRLFYIPKDETLRKTWEKNIPNNEVQFKNTSRVCQEHFLPEDIIKCDETIIQGKVHSIPRQNWKLKIGAYPSIFTLSPASVVPLVQRKAPLERKPLSNVRNNYKGNCPSHLKSAKKKGRVKAVTKNLVQEIQVKGRPIENDLNVVQDRNLEGVVETLPVLHLEVNEAALVDTNVSFPQSDIASIILPASTWKRGSLINGCVNYFDIQEKVNTVTIQKLASVDFTNRSFKQTIINRELTEIDENKNSFTSLSQVEELLRNLHKKRICPGIINDKEKHLNQTNGLIRNGKLVDGVWRANKCSLIIQESGPVKPCRNCKCLDKAMKIQFKRRKTINLHTKINHMYLTVKQLSQKVAAKSKKESKLNIILKKKNEKILSLKT